MPTTVIAPVVPGSAGPRPIQALRPVSLAGARVQGGFWADMQRLNRDAIIPHCDSSLERVGWVENFRAARRGTLATDRVGRLFTDSEIYKTMEAIAWEDAREHHDATAERLREYAELVGSVQAEDGYLSTYYGYPGGPERYSDLEWGHELYCAGHLIQAAVACARTGGPAAVVEAGRRLADHVCREFGPDGRQTIDGHPEIETALVELSRVTGERRYLDQARLFVDRRGHRTLGDTMYKGRDYYQDNVPVREAEVLVGHAVRALYLAAGAIDVAVETGDAELLAAVRRQYDRTLERRTYLTGGMGANHHGETYGDDFELPSERAYAETCAAVASVHVAWRLLLATGDERYADVVERTLYNSIVSSPSQDGTAFFYVNALQRRSPGTEPEAGVPSLRRTDGMRASWFTTSCCPTNVARLLSSLGAYLATTDDTGVQLHQYATGSVEVEVAGGPVRLAVETAYPQDGTITVRVEATPDEAWTLGLRVPAWARGARLTVAGRTTEVEPGRAAVGRRWRPGDEVVLELPMAPRFVLPDPRVDHVRGCAAVERGPLVYALESVDQPGVDLDRVVVDLGRPPESLEADLGLAHVAPVRVHGEVRAAALHGWPYAAELPVVTGAPVELTLIPYFRWANRGASTMRVWLPRADVPVS
ncbi:hypothetical protein AGMMS50218_00490 [Actinomycetota bacterium]|nr:hypothetical protein AGMMS50218_00490 [Actinomycetota bacterium]